MINSLAGIIYSILTILPLFLLLTFPFKSIVITIITLIPLIIIYRSFVSVHLYDFEESETSVPGAILIFLFIISLILSWFFLDNNLFFIFSAIPIAMTFYFVYIFVVYDFIEDYSDSSVFIVKHNHLIFTSNNIQLLMITKLIILTYLFITNKFSGENYLWILSFVVDFLVIIDKRKSLYIMRLYQEGFKTAYKKSNYTKGVLILFLLPLVVSIPASRNSSILPYTVILDFLNGLTFEYSEPLPDDIFSEHEPEFESSGSLEGLLDGNMEPTNAPEWLQDFLDIILKTILLFSFLLIVYLLLYPIFSPLFKKRGGKVTFKEYYLHIIESIKEFFRGIFKIEHSYKREFITEVYVKNRSINKVNIKKRREINTLLKYYLRLIKWNKNNYNALNNSVSVNDFFDSIIVEDEYLGILNNDFNIGFYSKETIGTEKLKEIKDMVRTLINKYQ